MLHEHKHECFSTFQEIKESHDRFWEFYKGVRQKASEHFKSRVRANIESNREKLAKAEAFRDKQQVRADDLREKLEQKNSAKWQANLETWLAEAEELVRSAEEQIEQLTGWISEGEEKLER